jgi:hypothetical protein
MSSYQAGDSYYGEFCTQRFDTGAATDADSTPTATATKNGADDGTFSLTVTKITTGRYKITGTVPAGYSVGDVVQISVAATVNSVAGSGVVDQFTIDPIYKSLNTATPASPTTNSVFDEMRLIRGVVSGTTNVSGSQVQFRDRSNTVAVTINYNATDGGRDTTTIA